MKQSGIDWIGEIPDDWKISKAKTILRNKSIKNHPDAEVLSLYRDLGIVPKNSLATFALLYTIVFKPFCSIFFKLFLKNIYIV